MLIRGGDLLNGDGEGGGGQVGLMGGSSLGNGRGGDVGLEAGSGGSSGGNGGDVNLLSGYANGGDFRGGDVNLQVGPGSGAGRNGIIRLTSVVVMGTTTIEFGLVDAGATGHHVCYNTKNTAGEAISFYFVGTTMVVESNLCK